MNHWFSIIPKSPLYIGSTKPNYNFLFSQDMIPGSLLRGAVAEYFLYRGEDDKISEFLKDTRFGFFRPSKSGLQLSLPLPLSTMACKKSPGFKKDYGHGVMDSLIPLLAYREMEKRGAEFAVPFLLRCEKCNSRMERFSGFYVKNGNYENVEVPKSSHTKVAINRKRKSAEEGMLYSITAITPGVVFTGRITIGDDRVSILKEAIEKMGIGGLTTRGYGRVEIKKEEDLFSYSEDEIKRRVEKFNEMLRNIWKDLLTLKTGNSSIPEEPEDLYLSVQLISPAILKDRAGLPTLELILNIDNMNLGPALYLAQPEFLGGWSTAWGLPKETELGVKMGSVYIYKVKKDRINDDFYKSLLEIELNGVGERTDEGFGEVIICNPFHLEVMPC